MAYRTADAPSRDRTSFAALQAHAPAKSRAAGGDADKASPADGALTRLDKVLLLMQALSCITAAVGEVAVHSRIKDKETCFARACRLGWLFELGPGVPCEWAPTHLGREAAMAMGASTAFDLGMGKLAALFCVALIVLFVCIPLLGRAACCARREDSIAWTGAVCGIVLALPTLMGFGVIARTTRAADSIALDRALNASLPYRDDTALPICNISGLNESGIVFVVNFVLTSLSMTTLISLVPAARASTATSTDPDEDAAPAVTPERSLSVSMPSGFPAAPQRRTCDWRRARVALYQWLAMPFPSAESTVAVVAVALVNAAVAAQVALLDAGPRWPPAGTDLSVRYDPQAVARGELVRSAGTTDAQVLLFVLLALALVLTWGLRVVVLWGQPGVRRRVWRHRHWLAPSPSAIVSCAFFVFEAAYQAVTGRNPAGAQAGVGVMQVVLLLLPVAAIIASRLTAIALVSSATAQLRAAEATLHSFILWSNHEMRTLLTPLTLVADELRDIASGEVCVAEDSGDDQDGAGSTESPLSDPERAAIVEQADSVKECTTRSSDLLTTVLDYFQAISAGRQRKPDCKWADAADAFRGAIGVAFPGALCAASPTAVSSPTHRAAASSPAVRLHIDPGLDEVDVLTGMDSVTLATTNLVSNAIKFKSRESCATVRVQLWHPSKARRSDAFATGPTPPSAAAAVMEPMSARSATTDPSDAAVDRGVPGVIARAMQSNDHGVLVVEVEDDGPGVDLDMQHNLFQAFASVGTVAEGWTSTGLGLALVRESVSQLGGRVGYRWAARPGGSSRGSVFWLELPVAVRTRAPPGVSAASAVAVAAPVAAESSTAGDELHEATDVHDETSSGSGDPRADVDEAAVAAPPTAVPTARSRSEGSAAKNLLMAKQSEAPRTPEGPSVGSRAIAAAPSQQDSLAALPTLPHQRLPSAASLRGPLPSLASPAMSVLTLPVAGTEGLSGASGAAEPNPGRRAGRRQRRPRAAKPKIGVILIVDDNGLIRDSFAKAVARLGFQAELASNGEEGLAALLRLCREASSALPLRAVLLDREMPVVGGMEMLARLRQGAGPEWDAARRIPIIMVTGGTSAEETAKAKAAGARGILCKPVSRSTIKAELDRVGAVPATRPVVAAAAAVTARRG